MRKVSILLERLFAWMDRDIARMDAKLERDWVATDMGQKGVPRKSVGFLKRYIEVFKAAKSGRYD
jgi:hypothetical protein